MLTDRVCWCLLGVAMALAAGLILYLNRGTTFNVDQIGVVLSSPTFDLADAFEPHNGHLGATTRLLYQGMLEVFGADYLPFRLLGVLTVLLAAGVFYAVAKRRIGAVAALAPTLVLLFLGSAWGHVVSPSGNTVMTSIAAGLGALLALERGSRRADAVACALVCLSIATFSTGLAFLGGVAVSVLLRRDRWRRAWIFLIPLGLYAAWWLVGPSADPEQQTKLSNVLLIPNYVAHSLALVTGALSGLDYDFADPLPPNTPGWGLVIGAFAAAALAVRIKRGNVPASLWVSLVILLAYWSLGALASGVGSRSPDDVRYIYPAAVGVLLVATDAARSTRFSNLGLLALFAATAVSLATNITLMRDGAAFFRNGYSTPVRTELAMVELARAHVDPEFDVFDSQTIDDRASTYLRFVDTYGSPALPLAALEHQTEPVRGQADQTLVDALGIRVAPVRSLPATAGDCRRVRAEQGGDTISFALPAGGVGLRGQWSSRASVTLGRFGLPSAKIGRLPATGAAVVRIPADASARPWQAVVSGARSVEACALR